MPSRSRSRSRSRSNVTRNLPDQFTPYDGVHNNPWDYFTNTGEFNLALFNKVFVEDQVKQHKYYLQLEDQKLSQLQLNEPVVKNSLLELSVSDQLINTKNTFFEILSDLQTKPLNINIVTQGNRLFYLGLLLVIIFIIYLILVQFSK
jgi:hypothetical protein